MNSSRLTRIVVYFSADERLVYESTACASGISLSNAVRFHLGLGLLQRGAPIGNKNRSLSRFDTPDYTVAEMPDNPTPSDLFASWFDELSADASDLTESASRGMDEAQRARLKRRNRGNKERVGTLRQSRFKLNPKRLQTRLKRRVERWHESRRHRPPLSRLRRRWKRIKARRRW